MVCVKHVQHMCVHGLCVLCVRLCVACGICDYGMLYVGCLSTE